MERNLRPNANSRKANTTLTVLSQPPDFMFFSTEGNMASRVKGAAKPMPKPSMVMRLTQRSVVLVERLTNAAPRIGPVQLNDTNTVVRAIKNGASRPPLSACSSDLLIHFSGILISNRPKKLREKMRKMMKKSRLGTQWVPIKYSASGPKIRVRMAPNTANRKTMENPKNQAWRREARLLSVEFMKKFTVIGIMGNTQGVNIVRMPPSRANRNTTMSDCFLPSGCPSVSATAGAMVSTTASFSCSVSVAVSVTGISRSSSSFLRSCSAPFTLKEKSRSSGAMHEPLLQSW